MQATVIYSHNPFHPARDRQIVSLKRKRSIAKLAPKTSAPFICLLNGKPLLRKDNGWKRTISDKDVVAFVVVPQGGKLNPLRLIAAIAVAIIAPEIAAYLAQPSFLGLTTEFAISALTAGISFAGNALVNALIPDPTPSLSNRSISSLQAASPTYNLSGQGNQARIGQAIPVMYGRNMIYMDYAAQPYTEYAGNEQYLFQLFVIGQGEYEIEQIRIEDSLIENNVIQDGQIHDATGVFEEVEYQVCYNQNVTLFPQNVNNSVEVSGQESIDANVYLGPFIANDVGTLATALGFDVVLPRGLYFANDDGGLSNVTCSYRGQYRPIDDEGNPIGAGTWLDAFVDSKTLKTTTPQRFSYKKIVPAGRYECRFTRTNTKNTNVRYGNDVNWGGLRAYLTSDQNYGNLTMLAIRIKASNQLNQQSSRRINVVATRMLSTYNGSSWTGLVPTRNPAWAFADIVTASYGMNLSTNRIDGNQLLEIANILDARGDRFDAIYDGQQPAWEALVQAARVGRSMPYLQGGNVYISRDSQQSTPIAMFTMRNIARNSFKLSYLLPSEETADAIDVEYWDNGAFQQKVVRAALPDSTQTTVIRRQLFGCSSRAQAYREGMYMAACNRYRRRLVTFQTEMEGFIPTVGDLIAIQHDMPQWGQGGEVVGYDADTLTLTLSEPVITEVGKTYYIALRNRNGSSSQAYSVTLTDNPKIVILNETPSLLPDVGYDREKTYYAFGEADRYYIEAKVLGVKPRDLEKVEISAVIDSDFVYNADTGAVPTESAWQLQNRITKPVIRSLIAMSDPNDVALMFLSWQPAAGAERYVIEISDSGEGWTRLGETSTANYTATAVYGNRTFIRVAAVGLVRGDWVEISYGSSASYMWSANDTDLMWDADDTVKMWRY